jgi:hypothetical protein
VSLRAAFDFDEFGDAMQITVIFAAVPPVFGGTEYRFLC